MAGYNQVILMGNLTRDIEVKTTTTGTNVYNFGLAINEKRKDSEKTHFIECTAFAKTGETMEKYLAKGSSVLIDGKLDFQAWEKDGQKRSKLGVIVNNFTFVGSKETAPQQRANSPDEISSEPLDLSAILF